MNDTFLRRVSPECSGHGECNIEGHCVCATGFSGSACEVEGQQTRVPEVRFGLLLPMFGTQSTGFVRETWSPLLGVYQALQEINNKSDGVADDLLPNTRLRFAYSDTKCDPTASLAAALHVTRDVFDGRGVSAIIGAGCSGASVTAARE